MCRIRILKHQKAGGGGVEEETVTESRGNSDQIISLVNVKSQDPAERSRLHADTTIILLPEGEIQR